MRCRSWYRRRRTCCSCGARRRGCTRWSVARLVPGGRERNRRRPRRPCATQQHTATRAMPTTAMKRPRPLRGGGVDDMQAPSSANDEVYPAFACAARLSSASHPTPDPSCSSPHGVSLRLAARSSGVSDPRRSEGPTPRVTRFGPRGIFQQKDARRDPGGATAIPVSENSVPTCPLSDLPFAPSPRAGAGRHGSRDARRGTAAFPVILCGSDAGILQAQDGRSM